MSKNLPLGELLTSPQEKDAIHVAVAPVTVGTAMLHPGEHVKIEDGLLVRAHRDDGIGIVDPFLKVRAVRGDRVWLFLYPGTITSLRHDWSHPAFPVCCREDDLRPTAGPTIDKAESEKWLRLFASNHGYDYDEMIEDARISGHYITSHNVSTSREDVESEMPDFWRHLEIVTGTTFSEPHRKNLGFNCSC